MGLSAFSRARVSQLPELELEAARFDEWNKAHQKGVRDADELHSKNTDDAEGGAVAAIREQAGKDVMTIGEKVVAGLAENTPEGQPIDKPLRLDHVRDMVGRRHVEDPQGEPKSTLDRLHDRIPTAAAASEALVDKTDVDSEGPTKEEVDAATEEQKSWAPPEEQEPEPELPAAGSGAGVPGAADESSPAPTDGATVPPTTQV